MEEAKADFCILCTVKKGYFERKLRKCIKNVDFLFLFLCFYIKIQIRLLLYKKITDIKFVKVA